MKRGGFVSNGNYYCKSVEKVMEHGGRSNCCQYPWNSSWKPGKMTGGCGDQVPGLSIAWIS